MAQAVQVINGPNLNLLGEREPHIYGSTTWPEIERELSREAGRLGVEIGFFQSNHEGELVDRIQECRHAEGMIVNPGALSHTSLAMADALRTVTAPIVEVHLSNIHAREDYRRTSLTAASCRGVVSGLGAYGYLAALQYLVGEMTK